VSCHAFVSVKSIFSHLMLPKKSIKRSVNILHFLCFSPLVFNIINLAESVENIVAHAYITLKNILTVHPPHIKAERV